MLDLRIHSAQRRQTRQTQHKDHATIEKSITSHTRLFGRANTTHHQKNPNSISIHKHNLTSQFSQPHTKSAHYSRNYPIQ
ncbi:hypothetical protein EUGRSUZ_K01886 [Eucalyptus grandis]|uniref:Uncharacterized protein n=2 Tax=Eucalyptus grandis TaxID=71139 RepID=A0ACC3IUU0_EUCGR|nr:hypothetical protein EUGRSUZ_K01886 [Eucalyptus grandis]